MRVGGKENLLMDQATKECSHPITSRRLKEVRPSHLDLKTLSRLSALLVASALLLVVVAAASI
jgi:hypothetical protein